MAHIAQAMTDMDPNTTLLSVDGIGAFDLISREAMLQGLLEVEGGGAALPFVRQFYKAPSMSWWTDDLGVTHEVWQGEGGEQGDPLMPALYACGQHRALLHVSRGSPHVCWNAKCGITPRSSFTKARHNFGTEEASLHKDGRL